MTAVGCGGVISPRGTEIEMVRRDGAVSQVLLLGVSLPQKGHSRGYGHVTGDPQVMAQGGDLSVLSGQELDVQRSSPGWCPGQPSGGCGLDVRPLHRVGVWSRWQGRDKIATAAGLVVRWVWAWPPGLVDVPKTESVGPGTACEQGQGEKAEAKTVAGLQGSLGFPGAPGVLQRRGHL